MQLEKELIFNHHTPRTKCAKRGGKNHWLKFEDNIFQCYQLNARVDILLQQMSSSAELKEDLSGFRHLRREKDWYYPKRKKKLPGKLENRIIDFQ